MTNGRKKTSVTSVVVWMVVFFPVGIYFWHKKLTEDKTETLKNSKYSNAIGWILLMFGIINAYLGVTGQLETTDDGKSNILTTVVMILIFIVVGAVIIKRSKQMKFLGEQYKKYEDIVKGKEITIAGISKLVSISEEEVIKDLQHMIDGGFFSGGHIDMQHREIVLPNKEFSNYSVNNAKNQDNINFKDIEKEPKRKAIKCPHCGAPCEVVEGRIIKCEFCGSSLNYED